MDQTRKLVVLSERDPKAFERPLVGVWISGLQDATDPRHPYVWAACARFARLPRDVADTVTASDGSRAFLLLVFHQAQSVGAATRLYECTPQAGHVPYHLSCSATSLPPTGTGESVCSELFAAQSDHLLGLMPSSVCGRAPAAAASFSSAHVGRGSPPSRGAPLRVRDKSQLPSAGCSCCATNLASSAAESSAAESSAAVSSESRGASPVQGGTSSQVRAARQKAAPGRGEIVLPQRQGDSDGVEAGEGAVGGAVGSGGGGGSVQPDATDGTARLLSQLQAQVLTLSRRVEAQQQTIATLERLLDERPDPATAAEAVAVAPTPPSAGSLLPTQATAAAASPPPPDSLAAAEPTAPHSTAGASRFAPLSAVRPPTSARQRGSRKEQAAADAAPRAAHPAEVAPTAAATAPLAPPPLVSPALAFTASTAALAASCGYYLADSSAVQLAGPLRPPTVEEDAAASASAASPLDPSPPDAGSSQPGFDVLDEMPRIVYDPSGDGSEAEDSSDEDALYAGRSAEELLRGCGRGGHTSDSDDSSDDVSAEELLEEE